MGFGGIAVLAGWSIALLLIDATSHRLPNPLTVPPTLASVAACALHPQLAWGLLWPAGYLLLGRGIGGGDIKLAVPLGVAVCALAGPLGVLWSVALSGALTVLLAVAARAERVAHGPSMLVAAWLVPIVSYLWV